MSTTIHVLNTDRGNVVIFANTAQSFAYGPFSWRVPNAPRLLEVGFVDHQLVPPRECPTENRQLTIHFLGHTPQRPNQFTATTVRNSHTLCSSGPTWLGVMQEDAVLWLFGRIAESPWMATVYPSGNCHLRTIVKGVSLHEPEMAVRYSYPGTGVSTIYFTALLDGATGQVLARTDAMV
jgi:hypothetical protein